MPTARSANTCHYWSSTTLFSEPTSTWTAFLHSCTPIYSGFIRGPYASLQGKVTAPSRPHIPICISDDYIAKVWRQIFRSTWKDFGTRFKQILDSLGRHKQLIVEQAALIHFQQYQDDSQKALLYIQQYEQDRSGRIMLLKTQEEAEMNRKYLGVLEWFSAAQSTVQDHQTFRDIRSKYAGSGDWILKDEKVQNWMGLDIPVTSVLWLNGIPGAGMLNFLPSFIRDFCLLTIVAYFC
jgi:hypothetical protein